MSYFTTHDTSHVIKNTHTHHAHCPSYTSLVIRVSVGLLDVPSSIMGIRCAIRTLYTRREGGGLLISYGDNVWCGVV